MSYDSRLAFDPSLERAGAIENLIEQEPHLFSLQRRCELAEGRSASLARCLANTTPGEYRTRLEATYRWAVRIAYSRANALQSAIEEWGEE